MTAERHYNAAFNGAVRRFIFIFHAWLGGCEFRTIDARFPVIVNAKAPVPKVIFVGQPCEDGCLLIDEAGGHRNFSGQAKVARRRPDSGGTRGHRRSLQSSGSQVQVRAT